MKTIQQFNNFFKANRLITVCCFAFFVVILNTYLFTKYRIDNPTAVQLTLKSDVDRESFSLYIMPEHSVGIDFSRPIKAVAENGIYTFKLPGNARNFRLYIETPNKTATLEKLSLVYPDKDKIIPFTETKLTDIHRLNDELPTHINITNSPNGYIQLKREMISQSEFILASFIILLCSLGLTFICIITLHGFFNFEQPTFNLKIFSVCLFLFSIFLPIPIFNVAFILSFAIVLRDFNYRQFIASKTGLLFLLFFFLFVSFSIFISQAYNKSFTETMLPFLFLPFYFACIPKAAYLKIFHLTAIVLSLYLFATSSIDAIIFQDLTCFSFDAFSKYLHPVYFSYLLFFAIVYIENSDKSGVRKIPALSILLLALISCASKLIISLTLLFYGMRFLKKNRLIGGSIIIVMILGIFLFTPTRKRFQEIFDLHNLSILTDHPIQSYHDARLNGLTLRLIIWQESLAAIDGVRDLVFGKGIDKDAENLLQIRLETRGLESGHARYDPHNQFIASLYKMGLLGLLILVAICSYLFYQAYKRKNALLFYGTLLFALAMCTESVLQRVVGIYFFICILLLLSDPIINPARHFENSNTRNKRNS